MNCKFLLIPYRFNIEQPANRQCNGIKKKNEPEMCMRK